MNKLTVVVSTVAIALALTACGGDPAPVPTVTATVTAEPLPAVTVTPAPIVKVETKTVNKTPQSCLDAIDYGEQGFDLAAESAEAAVAGFQAIADQDISAMEDVTQTIQSINGRLSETGDKWNASKTECRNNQ